MPENTSPSSRTMYRQALMRASMIAKIKPILDLSRIPLPPDGLLPDNRPDHVGVEPRCPVCRMLASDWPSCVLTVACPYPR